MLVEVFRFPSTSKAKPTYLIASVDVDIIIFDCLLCLTKVFVGRLKILNTWLDEL